MPSNFYLLVNKSINNIDVPAHWRESKYVLLHKKNNK